MKPEILEGTPSRGIRSAGIESWVASFGSDVPSLSAIHANQVSLGTGKENTDLRLLFQAEQSVPAVASNFDGSVIFDGWLHNGGEIIDELQLRVLPDASDAKIILEAYFAGGQEIIERFRGTFAFVLWDKRRNLLFSVRDPLGVFPLFYTKAGEDWLFCTSIEPLLRHPLTSRALNRPRLVDHLCGRWLSINETYYAHIYRVPPGHFLLKTASDTKLHRYWNPVSVENVQWVTEDAFDRFDVCLERAVRRCLKVGQSAIFLSGGLDSVSVASVATDIARRNATPTPLALSLVFPHPDCNEEAVQKSVAEGLGISQQILALEDTYAENGLLESAVVMGSAWPSPILTPWRPSYYHLGLEAARRGCSVIMTGGGGDDWLTVVPNYAADLIRDWNVLGLYRFTRNLLRSHRIPPWKMLRFIMWQSGFRKLLGLYANQLFKHTIRSHRLRKISNMTHEWLAPDAELRSEIDSRVEKFVAELDQRPKPVKHHGFYFSNLPELYIRPFWSIEMEEEFELGRRLGLWLLGPYRDPELVNLLLHVPPEILLSVGREKGMVRHSVAKRFPNLKFEKQRKVDAIGFLQSVLRSEGPQVWSKMGGVKSLIELGIVKAQAMDSVLQSSLSSDSLPHNFRIYDLLTLEAWVRSHV